MCLATTSSKIKNLVLHYVHLQTGGNSQLSNYASFITHTQLTNFFSMHLTSMVMCALYLSSLTLTPTLIYTAR
jgi:ABC-type transporter MlaC component